MITNKNNIKLWKKCLILIGISLIGFGLYITFFNAMMQQMFVGTITLKADNTYTSTMGGDPDTGTWSLSADGKKFTIDSDYDDPVTLDIIEQTANSLKLQMTQTETDDLNGDSIDETVNIVVTINFTK